MKRLAWMLVTLVVQAPAWAATTRPAREMAKPNVIEVVMMLAAGLLAAVVIYRTCEWIAGLQNRSGSEILAAIANRAEELTPAIPLPIEATGDEPGTPEAL